MKRLVASVLRRAADHLDPVPDMASTIRANLVARAEAFSAWSGMSLSAIGKSALRDDRFVHRAKAGHNFTLKTYQQLIDWIDEQERAAA